MRVPLASNGLTNRQIADAIEVLESGDLTMGRRVAQFEQAMAQYVGAKHFVMMNSGSSANLALVESLLRPASGNPELSRGDEVLVPAIAWPTTVWPLVQLGLVPTFVDVDEGTLAIDLVAAEKAVESSPRVRGMFPIHPLGFGIEAHKLGAFCEKHNLVLINDVCESLGSFPSGKHAGSSGLGSTFSFYFSHHITTMEGGGVATNHDSVADNLRSIRSHGWSRDRSDREEWDSKSLVSDKHFNFVSAGYNLRPMEIQAAMGISELTALDSYIARRREIAKAVSGAISSIGLGVIGGDTFGDRQGIGHSWMHIPIRLEDSRYSAADLRRELSRRGVENRPVLTGNFLRQPVASSYLRGSGRPDQFPAADRIASNAFLVSSHHSLSDAQVNYMCEALVESATALKDGA